MTTESQDKDKTTYRAKSGSVLGRNHSKSLLLVAAALALLAWGGHWIYERYTHVYIDDAKIDGRVITISSSVSGVLSDLPVIEGDVVKQGQLLARIDEVDSVLQRDVLTSKLRTIESQMAVARTQTGQVAQETQGRYHAESSRLAASEAEAASLKSQLTQAEGDYKRMQDLGKFASGLELDHARSALQQARELHRKSLSEIAAVRGALSSAGGSRRQVDVIGQQLLVLARQADEIRAEIKRREIDIAGRTITAPTNGNVVMTFMYKGEYVSAGQRILMFHDPNEIWVSAKVKETDVGRLKTGMKADIRVDAYPGKVFKAEVFRIGRAATNLFALLPDPNPSGNFTKITQRLPLRLKLLDKDATLRPGMMVEVYVATGND